MDSVEDLVEEADFDDLAEVSLFEAAVDELVVAGETLEHQVSETLALGEDELVDVVGLCGGADVIGLEGIVLDLLKEESVTVVEAGAEQFIEPLNDL